MLNEENEMDVQTCSFRIESSEQGFCNILFCLQWLQDSLSGMEGIL